MRFLISRFSCDFRFPAWCALDLAVSNFSHQMISQLPWKEDSKKLRKNLPLSSFNLLFFSCRTCFHSMLWTPRNFEDELWRFGDAWISVRVYLDGCIGILARVHPLQICESLTISSWVRAFATSLCVLPFFEHSCSPYAVQTGAWRLRISLLRFFMAALAYSLVLNLLQICESLRIGLSSSSSSFRAEFSASAFAILLYVSPYRAFLFGRMMRKAEFQRLRIPLRDCMTAAFAYQLVLILLQICVSCCERMQN